MGCLRMWGFHHHHFHHHPPPTESTMASQPAASPTKRRAALAALDANAMSAASPRLIGGGKDTAAVVKAVSSPAALWSASAALAVGAKRAAAADRDDDATSLGLSTLSAKKPRLDEDALQHHQQRVSRSHSPDSVSVFDTSAGEGDSSWATAATEPDHVAAAMLARPRPRSSLTREQAREKAEILRLRLGLASYKVRTGQVAVPLADLRHLPLPSAAVAAHRRTVRVQSPAPSTSRPDDDDDNDEDETNNTNDDDADENNAGDSLPQSQQSASTFVSASTAEFETSVTIAATPERKRAAPRGHDPERGDGLYEGDDKQEEGPRSALRGGAAKGLLSLARASMS
ncbi:whi5 like domain-containing protein [Purpureocillium lavendulum]|uniref:Whi5 like domain-containing protein n=1 Tax=Purpureocillium lavendulum TaxID=1247861 RepID=A0AB34G4Y5_9HYPO|nr:whi5 like domain-containing protein [Purpureocillium lavendulum]